MSVQLGTLRWKIRLLIPDASKLWTGSQNKHLTGTFQVHRYTKSRAHPLGHGLELTPLHSFWTRASLHPPTHTHMFAHNWLVKQPLFLPSNPTLFVSLLPIHKLRGIIVFPCTQKVIQNLVWEIFKHKSSQEKVGFFFRETSSLLNAQPFLFLAMYLNLLTLI